MKIHTYQSVWDAIADSSEEAANLKIRSQLMDILAEYIRREGITQKEASLRFGVPRSRVSELVNDRISKFTIDKLVNMAARVGLTPLNIDSDVFRDSKPRKRLQMVERAIPTGSMTEKLTKELAREEDMVK